MFRHRSGTLYILAQVDFNMVALISLDDECNRFYSPQDVRDVNNISKKEWERIVDGEVKAFKRVMMIGGMEK